MKKRTKIVAGIITLAIVMCSACGNSEKKENVAVEKTEKKNAESEKPETTEIANPYGEKTMDEIKADLEKSDFIVKEYASDGSYHVEKVKLIKRNTTESTDDVFCTITVNSKEDSIIQDYELIYNHYTTGGWILDEYMATSEASYLPLAGVDEVNIESDISEQFGSDCKYEILEHKTDLDSCLDYIKVHVKTKNRILKASGTVLFYYAYLDGAWGISDCTREDDYKEYNDFTGTWVCDYAGDGSHIRLFLVKKQDGKSMVGDYVQLQILPTYEKIRIFEEFKKKPFTDQGNGTIFWDSQGYEIFHYNENTIMEIDDKPYEKYSDSYMTLKKYLADNYPGYEISEE